MNAATPHNPLPREDYLVAKAVEGGPCLFFCLPAAARSGTGLGD